jgi:HlyD family secretion protein
VVAVENPEKLLLPGMTAYVNIAVAHKKGVLLVPNAALRFKPAGTDKAEKGADGKAGAAEAARPSGGQGMGGAQGAARERRRETGSGTVHVLDGGEIKPVKVGIGITDARFTEVASGDLQEGARVITGENLPNAEPASSSTFRMRMF